MAAKEFSETQKVTLLLHMMEHLVFPDAKLTREIKLKTIEYAKDIMGLEVHMSSLEKLFKTWKTFTYIQDGAKAHTAEGSVRELERAGSDPLTVPIVDRVCVEF